MSLSKRKLLFVLGSLKMGGAERNMAKVASYFAENDHDVHILLFENIIDFEIHPSIQVHVIGLSKIKNRFLKAIKLYFSVVRTVWSLRPNFAIGFARISSQTLALTLYPKIVARFDSYPFEIRWYRTFFALTFFNFFNVKGVVCPSNEIKEKISPYFLNKGKLKVIGNPVDLSVEFTNSIPSNPLMESKYIIVVGRLSERKRVCSIIDAYSTSSIHRVFDLVIVGDGPEMSRLKNLAMESPVSHRIRFTGHLKGPQAMIQGSSLLVLASSKEGFPTVLVEALSLGIPVLSSDCRSGPSEIVKEGINGWLFSLTEVDALVKKFEEIAVNPEMLSQAAKNARDSVSAFDKEVVMSKWKNLLTIEK